VSGKRVVSCPIRGKQIEWCAENRWRPFCSERCKKIDLGAWASEGYRVAGSEPDPGELNPGSTLRE
jgi:endogenous inhibitor of DNA gyrase (YacG/DUF329 family)